MKQLEALQRELEARMSTFHFAHAAVSLGVGLVLAGGAGKLFWDSIRLPLLGVAAAAISLGCLGYSLFRYARGQSCLRVELERFESLKALRRSLRLDDPSALLPR